MVLVLFLVVSAGFFKVFDAAGGVEEVFDVFVSPYAEDGGKDEEYNSQSGGDNARYFQGLYHIKLPLGSSNFDIGQVVLFPIKFSYSAILAKVRRFLPDRG